MRHILPKSPSGPILRIAWSPPQWEFLHADEPYVDFEGAVRAGKTTPLCWKVLKSCVDYPGIRWAMARWTQDGLDAQLRPKWREVCREAGIVTTWHPAEEYDELPNGSVVYLRALKSAEETNRYGKLAGLTLAGVAIDQPEEVPADIYHAYIPARLSQPNMPHQVLLTPNPPDNDHWIADEFMDPENPKLGQVGKPGHRYIRTTVYDNRDNLGDDYIAKLEAAYPVGSPLRRRFIEGKRGLSVIGEPVYGRVFRRTLHVSCDVVFNPALPLLESWDFGHKHPAVLWSQFMFGAWHVLGELMGRDQFIENFAPQALQQRNVWFPEVADVRACCDPAGMQNNSQGTMQSAVDVLHQHGIFPRAMENSNHPLQREAAIQHLSAAFLRLTPSGPAVLVHPRCQITADGFEAGYVFDDLRVYGNTQYPNLRRPKKDGFYDHLMNCCEYTWLNFGSAPMTRSQFEKKQHREELASIKQAQRDIDPYDFIRRLREQRVGGRAGM